MPLGTLPAQLSVFNAMDRYAHSKLLLTTFSHELGRRQHESLRVVDICPVPGLARTTDGTISAAAVHTVATRVCHGPC